MLKRDAYCGKIRLSDAGKEVTLNGWIRKVRDFGKFAFVDMWDHTGLVQAVFDMGDEKLNGVKGCIVGDCVGIRGTVVERKDKNPDMATGDIEITAGAFIRYSVSEPLPISENPSEEIRLKYRYIDLRTDTMQGNLRFRHKVIKAIREHMDYKGFIEVETPVLSKSTPEGARDYLVPSRMQKGAFYALPQSPQIYKQLLMIGGVDKYFQIARCFRDEDLRANRQPEFTQLDVEMAYAAEEDVFSVTEELFKYTVESVTGEKLDLPFRRMTHREAMADYGTDKPDLRFGLRITDVTEEIKYDGFKVMESNAEKGGRIHGIKLSGFDVTRKIIDGLTETAKKRGAGGLMWFRYKDGVMISPVSKFLPDAGKSVERAFDMSEGDMVFMVAADASTASAALGAVRLGLRDIFSLADEDRLEFLWVTEFPMFFYNEDEGRYETEHHPFTMPDLDDVAAYMESDPLKIRSRSYDLVLNGEEIASGSVRNHISGLQDKVFEKIGITPEEREKRFGFFIKALKYGTPPHAGIAPGIDRFVQILLKAESIRDVIAFPKTTNAACLMTESPSEVGKKQLDDLGIMGDNKK